MNLTAPFIVTTIAGTSGRYGFQDGGIGQNLFYNPKDVAVSRNPAQTHFAFITDTNNHRIRRLVVAGETAVELINKSTTCVNPTAPQPGYSYSVKGPVKCIGLTATAISCENQPTCARGYYGHPSDANHSCGAMGAQLTLGGCEPCPTKLNASATPRGDFCVCPNEKDWQTCLSSLTCWMC